MTLPTSGHHARVVALGGIAKRKRVSSRASLLISVKCLWLTLPPLVTKPGQCPLTSILEEKRMKIKGMNGLGNIASMTGAAHPPQRHPPVSHPCYHCTFCPGIPIHLTHLHDLDLILFRNIPLPVDTSPIGRPVTSSKLALQTCMMSLSTRLG